MNMNVFNFHISVGWKTITTLVVVLIGGLTLQINPFKSSTKKQIRVGSSSSTPAPTFYWISGCSPSSEQNLHDQLTESLQKINRAITVLNNQRNNNSCVRGAMKSAGFGAPAATRQATRWDGPVGGTVWAGKSSVPLFSVEQKTNRIMLLNNLRTFRDQMNQDLKEGSFELECSQWNLRCHIPYLYTPWFVGIDLNFHICNTNLHVPFVLLHEMSHKYLCYGGHPGDAQPFDNPSSYARVITSLSSCHQTSPEKIKSD